jgi:hypothetical protein
MGVAAHNLLRFFNRLRQGRFFSRRAGGRIFAGTLKRQVFSPHYVYFQHFHRRHRLKRKLLGHGRQQE